MAVFRVNTLVSLKLVTLTLVLFCYMAANAAREEFLSSMDFARSSLMKYSAGSRRVGDVLTPVRPSDPDEKNEMLSLSRPLHITEKPVHHKTTFDKPDGLFSLSVGSEELPHFGLVRPNAMHTMETIQPTLKPHPKIYKSRASPSNKFLEALNEIERAVAAAGADTRSLKQYSPEKLREKLQQLAALINKAADRRSFRYARALVGQALYFLKVQQSSSDGRPKRTSSNNASQFLDSLKNRLGDEKFNTFLAVQGDVTLMFAIDDTGSMSDDLNKAKQIARDVVYHDRNEPVDYILSPFNDPEPVSSRVMYKDQTQTDQFVEAINKLKAHAGGDCPELTFWGMIEAICEGPRWGSPMYVFTDAYPKDDTEGNIDELEILARDYGVTINFFTTGQCNTPTGGAHPSFKAIASATNGQVFSLSNSSELGMLSGLTGSVLGGSNSISVGSNPSTRKRRGASGTSQHKIIVDDSIQELTVALTSANPKEVKLLNPTGMTVTSGKLILSKTVVYQLRNPQVGAWTLVVPHSAGEYEFCVKSTSPTNIDFETFFVFTPTRRNQTIPITHPLSGEQAKAVLTVAGVEKVVSSSLNLELITEHGRHIADVGLTSRSGPHFIATGFVPPPQPFKMKLKGNTINGNAFERISRNVVKPKGGVLRTLLASNEYTLRVGREDRVTLQLYSVGDSPEYYDFTAKDSLGHFLRLTRKIVGARPGRMVVTSVRLKVSRRGDEGKTDILFVRAKGRKSGVSLSHLVYLLVVD